ncbi:MAG: three-Cys-motif partner protein TcmP [Rhizomicrobium sp.]
MIDPDDGLLVAEDVGEWVFEKHERLRKYVDITSATRRKYTESTRTLRHPGGAIYIDLFCGPGRACIRETSQLIDGSPLVAFRSAIASGIPFTQVHLADIKPDFCAASVERIAKDGGVAFGYPGPAEDAAREIVSRLNPHGLHLAFLDPYNLAGLSFEIIRTLARAKHIDLLMHVSIQDIQRNSDRYTTEDCETFDAFAPGWRAEVNLNQNLHSVRVAVLQYWQKLLRELGFLDSRSELIRGDRNQRLYWLALASRHKIANYFWDEIRNTSGQRELKF